MPINITMPALSPTMEEGNLAKWLVKEGDSVSSGDIIAEIETDKATMEVEAVDEGTIAKILVAEGSEGVAVNAVIAILAEEGEDVGEAANAAVAQVPVATLPLAGEIEVKPLEAVVSGSDSIPPKATPLAARVAAQGSVDLKSLAGSGAKGKIVLADVTGETTAKVPMSVAAAQPGERQFASPLARKSANSDGVDISLVAGSGPNGRIIQRDVVAALASGTATAGVGAAAPTAPKTAMATGPDDAAIFKLYNEDDYEPLPHDGMRRIIAARLTESTQSIPVYFLTVDIELDGLLTLRAEMNSAAPFGEDEKPQWKISVNDFIVKAMALALQTVPMANASWTSNARLLHKHSDVGVAVAIPDGLLTPIVRQAELKSLSTISGEIKDMAGRARKKKLMPEEYQGGSTAVSNLGMFGVKEFTSIINPPQASIVSIGAGEKRAVVKNGELAVATIMAASFAFDHRVIDGALGAQLAAAFKNYLEKPAGMLA